MASFEFYANDISVAINPVGKRVAIYDDGETNEGIVVSVQRKAHMADIFCNETNRWYHVPLQEIILRRRVAV